MLGLPFQLDLQPSFYTNYAHNEFESAYPQLWQGLVGAWAPLLGPTGSKLIDLSKSKNNGTLTNMELDEWIIGGNPRSPGYVLHFDASEYVTMGDVLDFGTANPMSVIISIKTDAALQTATSVFVGKQKASGTFQGWSIQIRGGDAGDPYRIQLIDGASQAMTGNFARPSNTNWQDVAFTYDGSEAISGLTAYINADSKTITTIADNLDFSISNGVGLQISARDGTANPFPGSVGRVYIYDRVVLAEEIRILYQFPLAPFILRSDLFVKSAAAPITRILVAVPAAFSVVAATRSMGTVTKALAAIGSAYSIVGATRSMGAKTITATIPAASFSVVALKLLRTIKASIVSAAYSVVVATRSMGTKTITATIPSAAFSVVPATAVNAILRVASVISAAFSVVAPSRVMGTATRTVSAVSAAYSVVSATAITAILRTVAAISSAFSVVAPSRAMGVVTKTVSVISAAYSVVASTRVMGALTKALSPISAAYSVISSSRIMGTATRAVAAISSTFSVVSPTRVMGAMNKTVSAVAAAFSVKAVTTQLGAIVSFFLTSIITFSAKVGGAFSTKARVSGNQETKAKVGGKAEINKP